MGKAYFGPEFLQFLKQIKRNNRRPWFLKNRERYEEVVRKTGLRFVVDFGFRLKEISPWIVVDAKPNGGSLQRIYRDVRFSSDKRPYKTSVGMVFPHASRSEEVRAVGYFLHL
ncbi:MAG: TIGR02453 family protein, partial [Acidobacteria bacterium]